MKKKIKKILKITSIMLLSCFALVGMYSSCMSFQYQQTKSYAENMEADREYDDIMLYNEKGGEPIVWVNPEYKSTLFFMEGFRALSPGGMYEEWLKELYNKHNINIIVPVYGLQSWPFKQRNRGGDWHYQEDIRTTTQIYDAYTSLLPQGHRVIVVSMSFGTLNNLAICSEGQRKPDASILLSPLNSELDFKAAGDLVHWFSKQTSWLRYVMPFSKASTPPNRVSPWDIVNEEKNKEVNDKFYINPEDSSEYGYQNEQIAKWIESELVPRVQNMDITVIWGDSDLFFNQNGFKHLAEKLDDAGNTVETKVIENSGHMVLMDNGEDVVKSIILDKLIQNQ